MKRKIIRINEQTCTGCGLCIPNCPEGAIQVIDGKARLVSDLLCDGLGACLGHCPEGAITVEEREAEPYDERKVMETIIKAGPNTIRAHLVHLKEHGQQDYLQTARAVLAEQGLPDPLVAPATAAASHVHGGGCPGMRSMAFAKKESATTPAAVEGEPGEGRRPSQLRHWPIQLHLLSPLAPQYQGADVLLAADCTAFALGDFHRDYLKGKALAIACPKLDEGQDVYMQKIQSLIDDARINTLTIMIMQVPCCMGLVQLARRAAQAASRRVPLKTVVVGLQGDIQAEEWL